jgi:fucose permease
MGIVSQVSGSIAVAYLVPMAGYLFVMLYAFWGSRVKSASRGFGVS